MEFISNLNKIHYLLKEKFQNLEFFEKSNLKFGSYVEFVVKENMECRIIIEKKSMESNNISWKYLSNPLVENSHLVERSSSIENFVADVSDIFTNKRFDSEYIKTI